MVNFILIFIVQLSFLIRNNVSDPQLDLPPLPKDIRAKPEIVLNSYAEGRPGQSNEASLKKESSNTYDINRSQRFGPPYDDLSTINDNQRDLNYNGRPNNYRDDDIRPLYNRPSYVGDPRDDQYNQNPNLNNRYPGDPTSTYAPYTTTSRNPFYDTPRPSYGPYNDQQRDRDQFYNNRNYNNPNQYPGSYNQNDYLNPRPGTSQRPYPQNYNDDRRYLPGTYPTRVSGYPQNNYDNNRPYPYDQRDLYNQQGYYNPDEESYRVRQEYEQYNEDVRRELAILDSKSAEECTLNVVAQWNFETNVNEITQVHALAAQQRYSDFQRTVWEQMKRVDASKIYDPKLYRQVRLMSIIGPSALPPDQLDRYNRIVNDMLAIYNGASICGFEEPFNCGLRLQPDLKETMAKSRDWDELQYVWTEYRRKTGRDMRELFEQMVDLTNEAAHYNNFSNAEEYWSFPFDTYDFREQVKEIWVEILPLYELIHAYVRRKLREFYGPDKIHRHAPLPESVMGDMYGQSWANILDITIPYPGRSFLEVSPHMNAQGYTPLIMFQLAEEFYISMNMTKLPHDFWLQSIFQEPPDRVVLCQPSAWDFCNQHDYRIKMCTGINHKDLITVHHEMAHIQYFINYRNQPKVFRDGANPGFHEAIGDAVTLSVSTPKHLQTLGLVQKSVDDTAHDINYLFALAVDKIVFLPFALALDHWRWDVFSKRITKEQYNCHWWLLREQFGGIKPPVLRSEFDFDPGSKYHVPANIPYIRYFFATILQFQIHRALCRASGQYVHDDPTRPLHKCDIYRQPEAGNILKQLMEKGASQPWQEVLEEVIGEGRLDGTALREYFRPLEEWLRNENLRNQEFVGWNYDGDYCKHSIETANLQVFGGFYNSSSGLFASLIVFAVTILLANAGMILSN